MSSFTGSRGYAIHCHADDCRATTADQAPARFTRTAAAAVDAARDLGWMRTRTRDGEAVWICPMHQTWDRHTGRWTVARRQTMPQETPGGRQTRQERQNGPRGDRDAASPADRRTAAGRA